VLKLSAHGSALVASTFQAGGTRDGVITGLRLDIDGNAYVTGWTASDSLPTTPDALRSTRSGLADAFLVELTPSLDSATYATLLGGDGDDRATGLVIDAAGGLYVSGQTDSSDFAVSGYGVREAHNGFITNVAPTRRFVGFQQPVKGNGSSAFRLGRTIPVKFQLTNLGGDAITGCLARNFTPQISNGVTGTEQEAVSTSAADTGNTFRYAGNGQYVFNWGTSGFTQGTWQIRIQLDDGTSHSVRVSLSSR
jgi:hypothetical protein